MSRRGPRGASSLTWLPGPSLAGVSGWDSVILMLTRVDALSFQAQGYGVMADDNQGAQSPGGGGARGLSPRSLCGELHLLNELSEAVLCPYLGLG